MVAVVHGSPDRGSSGDYETTRDRRTDTSRLMEIVFSPEADDDVRAILDQGFDRWGDDATLAYVADLTTTIGRLATVPRLGRPEPGLPDRFRMIPSGRHRMIPSGRHRVFHRIDTNQILVVRILHQREHPGDRELIGADGLSSRPSDGGVLAAADLDAGRVTTVPRAGCRASLWTPVTDSYDVRPNTCVTGERTITFGTEHRPTA